MYKRCLRKIKAMYELYISNFRGNSLKREGILEFQDKQIMACARKYLERYEAKEVRQLIKGKSYLIFNKEIDRPFIKTHKTEPIVLIELIDYIENKFNKKLDQIDRAFLEWEVYEECDRRIVNEVLRTLFEIEPNNIERYIMIRRLSRWMIKGDYISIQDLKKLFGTTNKKRLVLYKYTHQMN